MRDYFKQFRRHTPLFIVGGLSFFCVVVWVLVFSQTPRGFLTVAVMNVGQGDSIYIESPTGVQVVIDGGPDNSLLRELPKLMPQFDRSIDALIETHPHADHLVGFIDLVKRYHVGAFIESGAPMNTIPALALEKEIDQNRIPRYLARRGMVLDLGGGVELDILYPNYDVSHLSERMVHEGAVVARLVYGSASVLFMSDAPKDVEDMLVKENGERLKSDVLKVGHHGSRTSTGEVFTSTVAPQIAIISVGAHNLYRLPNKEPIETLMQDGIRVLRTDQVGTVTLHSDGQTLWVQK